MRSPSRGWPRGDRISSATGVQPFGKRISLATSPQPWWSATGADAQSITEIFRALQPPDPDWLFPGDTAPTLIITGSEDVSHGGAFALQELIPGCELVTMEGAGHACNMERPWEWDAHALRFLAKHGLFDGQIAEASPGPRA
jgi:pimeloyl-ACP methyl ester carboxylesterase